MGLTVTGLVEVQDRLKRAQRNIPKVVGRAIKAEGEIEMAESMNRTPVEYGTLKASHVLLGPFYDDGIYCRIEVGGNAAPYAIYVHENLEAYHKIGQAKFLESTLLESRRFMAQRVAARIKLEEMFS